MHIFNSKPKARAYSYNKMDQTKTNIRVDENYIFVGDELCIDIEEFAEKNGFFWFQKKRPKGYLTIKINKLDIQWNI